MEFSSLQVCMDSSDWLQGTMSEDGGFDSSSSPTSHDMLTCSRPLIERRLRPPRDQSLKCPRCESTHTKFCYYNNYSLSQPRYFCKTCRRYWTKGGTLRNIPVGGGCRKNKKPTTTNGGNGGGGSNSKKSSSSSSSVQSLSSNDHLHDQHNPMSLLLQNSIGLSSSMMPSGNNNPTELQLSFPHHDQATFSQFSNLIGVHGGLGGDIGFMESKYNAMLENNNNNNNNNGNSCSNIPSRPIDFVENYKLDALVGHDVIRGHDFLGNGAAGSTSVGGGFGNIMGGINGVDPLSSTGHGHDLSGCGDYSGFCSPFGLASMDHGSNNTNAGGYGAFLDQRLMLPFDGNDHREMPNSIDVKPNATKLLSLQWQDQHQGCSDDRHNNNINGGTSASKGSFGYNNVGGLSSWSGTGMISGYGPPTTNPLV